MQIDFKVAETRVVLREVSNELVERIRGAWRAIVFVQPSRFVLDTNGPPRPAFLSSSNTGIQFKIGLAA